MTSLGRGRGWGLAQKQDAVLRRPGQSTSPKNSELNSLMDRIHNDVLIDSSTPKPTLNDLALFADTFADSYSIDDLVDVMWKRAMEERCFAIKLMKLFGHSNCSHLVTEKHYLFSSKKALWTKMQDFYEQREELSKENKSQLLNLAWMLGTHVGECHSKSKMLLKVMGEALVTCLELLVDAASEEDIQVVAIQTLCHAKMINEESKVDEHATIAKIVKKCRGILINRNVSARSRAHLLLVIEFANRRYESLNEELANFYAEIFGSGTGEKNYGKSEDHREFDADDYFCNILTRSVKSLSLDDTVAKTTNETYELPKNEINLEQTQDFGRTKSGVSFAAPVPRAIRGSGKTRTENIKDNGI